MTYIFKGAGFGLRKIGDVMTGLKGLGTIEIPPLPDNVFTLPEGAVRLSDGTVDLPAGAAIPDGAVRLADGRVRLPEGVIALPEGTLKNPFDEGAAYADRKGNLYDESGNLVQRAEDARTEPGKTDADTPDHARVENPARQPVLAGAGAHGGSNIGDRNPGSGDDHVPGNSGADSPEASRSSDGTDKAEAPDTHGPDGGWGGAGWVEQPSDYAARIYDTLRATPNHIDIPAMARNTGLDESVLRQVKAHMIRSQHDVVVRPGEWVRGRFTPRDDIASLWDGARNGTLDKAQVKEFRNLMTHEYVESRLMKAGLPYLQDQAGLWRKEADGTYTDGGRYSPKSLGAAGAHDLAPNPVRGGFGTAWQKLGLKHPKTELAADLSNIDDFVKDVFHELRAKGLNLK
ncbi:hypothetical protein [[Kitasatospora] papulosa]|uniref:hypothetical protein n=1 Tax=[Kitasatospora] papulosa TaxID=1464011 RepID=UPI0036AF8910